MLSELERHMDSNAKQVINNLQFLDKLNEASSLTGKISEMETLSGDTLTEGNSLQTNKNVEKPVMSYLNYPINM